MPNTILARQTRCDFLQRWVKHWVSVVQPFSAPFLHASRSLWYQVSPRACYPANAVGGSTGGLPTVCSMCSCIVFAYEGDLAVRVLPPRLYACVESLKRTPSRQEFHGVSPRTRSWDDHALFQTRPRVPEIPGSSPGFPGTYPPPFVFPKEFPTLVGLLLVPHRDWRVGVCCTRSIT